VHLVISPTHTTFIKDRLILDGVISLHEIIQELKVKKFPGILLKLDFEKTYEGVS
jgi:hypothetical protein